jgi:hypothetical protein
MGSRKQRQGIEGAAATLRALLARGVWRVGRCPCCRKRTEIVLGSLCNEMPSSGWCNLMNGEQAERLARAGTCPWCGRSTTTVARVLMQRFQPTLDSQAREGIF